MTEKREKLEEKYAAVHRRLIDWGVEHFYPGWAVPSPNGVLAQYAGRRASDRATALQPYLREYDDPVPCVETRAARMEVFVYEGDAMMCKPDGGLLRAYQRIANSIEHSRLCRVTGELLDMMPRQLWDVVRVKYRDCTRPIEIPREDHECWAILKISERSFYYRKKAYFTWLDARMFPKRVAGLVDKVA